MVVMVGPVGVITVVFKSHESQGASAKHYAPLASGAVSRGIKIRDIKVSPSEVSKMADLDKAVEDIEQGNAWNKTDEVVQVEVKKPLDKVIPVRLSADKWEEIRQEARELGIGPTTLARMWILEHLRQRVKA